MRLCVYRWMVLATLAAGCAEPTGTESGNPSQPGARAPLPDAPPGAPPLPILPVQPGVEVPDGVIDPSEQEPETSAPSTHPSAAPTIEEPNSTQPRPVGTGTVGATAAPQTVGGVGGTPSGLPETPVTGDSDSRSNPVDAGDAGGVDAGP